MQSKYTHVYILKTYWTEAIMLLVMKAVIISALQTSSGMATTTNHKAETLNN